MSIVINGSGTVTGLAVGGLPEGTVDADTVAADVATQAELDLKANIANFTSTGIDDNATSTAITIDAAENVGIGVTPESWSSNINALQVGDKGGIWTYDDNSNPEQFVISENVYNDATSTEKYIETDKASKFYQRNGEQKFFVAASGSADSAINWTTAMTIDNSGWVGIGVTPTSPFHVKHNSTVDGAPTFDNDTGESNTRTNISILRNGTSVGSIRTTTSSTSYNTSSDYRLKENVDYDWDATTRLKQLKPARFNFIKDDTTTVDGFLAHEVSDIVPEAISGEKDAVDDDGNAVHQSIDQSKLVPLLVKTIQELEARITALEA